jgi:hypothetical protein
MKTGTTIALGIGGVLAFLFFAGKAKGATGGAGGATPVEGGKPLAAPAQARVTSSIPMRLHTGPTTTTSVVGRASPGTIVQVVQTGIPSKEAASREWWEIVTPGGRGFVSAVGPGGEQNLVLI